MNEFKVNSGSVVIAASEDGLYWQSAIVSHVDGNELLVGREKSSGGYDHFPLSAVAATIKPEAYDALVIMNASPGPANTDISVAVCKLMQQGHVLALNPGFNSERQPLQRQPERHIVPREASSKHVM